MYCYDTLIFTFKPGAFELSKYLNSKSDNPLLVHYRTDSLSNCQQQPILLETMEKEVIYGKRLGLTKPIANTVLLNISQLGLMIQFSLGKLINQENLSYIGQEAIKEAKEIIQEKLELVGVFIDWKQANIYRADISQNIEVEKPIYEYIYLLKNRTTGRMSNEYHQQTLLVGNKSKQTCFYDKLTEMQAEIKDKNILRVENRFLNKQACCSVGLTADTLEAVDLEAIGNNAVKKVIATGLKGKQIDYRNLVNSSIEQGTSTSQVVRLILYKYMVNSVDFTKLNIELILNEYDQAEANLLKKENNNHAFREAKRKFKNALLREIDLMEQAQRSQVAYNEDLDLWQELKIKLAI